MKSIFSILVVLIFNLELFSQDTVTVQTFTWDSLSRSATFVFPDNPEDSYRKILMEYNMRCHDAQVGNGATGCREWDYHCNTVITDPSKTDSIKAIHPTHIISNFSNDIFSYSLNPTYNYIEYIQQEVEYTSTQSENETLFNNGNVLINLGSDAGIQKNQTILSIDKLQAAGLSTEEITGIKIYAEQDALVPFLRVKLSNYDSTDEFTPSLENVQDQYFNNTDIIAGENHLKFHTAFQWDGTSSILMELSYTSDNSVSLSLEADISDMTSTYVNDDKDHFINFTGIDYFDIDSTIFENTDSLLTISMWTRGDASLPLDTYLFEGKDDEDQRQASVHLPWSNAQIFWDCGNDGSGYDRINQQSNTDEFRDVWTHWTFIKDLNNSSMTILKNGNEWLRQNGKSKSIEISQFFLGAPSSLTKGYKGDIDDVRIWNHAVDLATIKDYMYKDLDDSHPYRDFLIADFNLDEGSGLEINGTRTDSKGSTDRNPNWKRVRGKDLRSNFSASDHTPKISLVQGVYTTQNNQVIILDSFPRPSHFVTEYQVLDNNLEELNTTEYFPSSPSSIFNDSGSEIGQYQNLTDGTISIGVLNYFRFSEARYEILSFITPYGNGLDLGPEGVTYTIDMTDYVTILKGEKLMSIEGRGNFQEELDIKFHFIKGTPHAEIKELKQIWPVRNANQIWAGFNISAIYDESVFEPRNIFIPNDISYAKLRSAITGHGQNGEFLSKLHYVNVNGGFEEAQYAVWKECGDNPVYPQGGTWIFDRAGWCPGMETDVFTMDLAPFFNLGEMNELDYGVFGSPVANMEFRVNNQLVLYDTPNYNNDVEILDILNPSSKTEYARFNPSCNLPNIIIRNSGAENLNSFDITYGMENGETLTETWVGNLNYLENITVELDVPDHHFWESGNGNFYVTVSNPNGVVDENPDNSHITSKYTAPLTSAEDLKIEIRTDNKPQDSRINIFDSSGERVLDLSGFSANSSYSLDLDLPGGCYTMELLDLSDDGLEFWFFPNNGTGWARILENNALIQNFDSDFGGNLYFDFIINGTTKTKDLEIAQSIGVSPNPVSELINIHWTAERVLDGTIHIIDQSGKVLIVDEISSNGNSRLNIENLHPGLYHIKILSKKGIITQSFIKN